MKILKVGKVCSEEHWTQNITCKECFAELEVFVTDVKKYYYYGTHFRHEYPGIMCPLCSGIRAVSIPKPFLNRTPYIEQKAIFDGLDLGIY